MFFLVCGVYINYLYYDIFLVLFFVYFRWLYIKELFVGRYIIYGYFYLRMYLGVELSEFLIILRCFNMEIKFGLNEYLKIIIL